MTDEDTSGPGDKGSEQIPRFRTADDQGAKTIPHFALAVTCLGIIAALFIALGVSNRDYAKSVSGTVYSLRDQFNDRIQELARDVRDIERCYLRRRNCP